MVVINKKHISIGFDSSTLLRRNRSLSVLLDINGFLASSLRFEEVLSGALAKVIEHFGVQAGRIYLLDQSGRILILAASQGIDTKGLEQVSITEGFSGKAVRTRSFVAQHVSDLADRERAALLIRQGFKVIICVPLLISDQVVGVMNLAANKTVRLNQQKADLLVAVGNAIAIAVNHAKLYGELERGAEQAKQQKETIEFFAHTASHDLKSPSVAIHGLAAILQRKYGDCLDEKGRTYCAQILSASEQVVALVDEINAYLRAKEAPLNLEMVRMWQIVEGIRNEFAATLSKRNVTLFEPGNLPDITADKVSITRVFRNLVENALKYGGERLSEIKIGYTDTHDHHVFSVSDNGVGLTPDVSLKKLFRPFYRHKTAKGTEGTGLGLAIVKEIAERHCGKAWVKGGLEKDTVFCVSVSKIFEPTKALTPGRDKRCA
jgi:signal transduction histidine kinase